MAIPEVDQKNKMNNETNDNVTERNGANKLNRNQRRRANARLKKKNAKQQSMESADQKEDKVSDLKPKPRRSKRRSTSGYDTEQMISKVSNAAKELAEAKSRFSQRISRAPPKETTAAPGGAKKKKNRRPKKRRDSKSPAVEKVAAAVPEEKPVTETKTTEKPKRDSEGIEDSENGVENKDSQGVAPHTPKGALERSSTKKKWQPVKKEEKKTKENDKEEAENKGTSSLGSDRFRGRKDIAHIVSSVCVEAGFEPTGAMLRKFRKDYFETTGFKDHYTKYLEDNLPKACDKQKELILCKLDMIENLKAEKDFSAGIVAGVPGCGKSTVLKKIQGQATDTILLYANPTLESCYKSFENSFYTQTALVADINHTFSTILIDEYSLCESAEILLLQRKFRASRIFLFGDRCQGDVDSLTSPEWLKIPRIFEGKRSHRFGKQTAELLKEFGLNIKGSDVPDQVVKSGYTGKVDEESTCLCFSTKTKDDLAECSIDCTLVEGTQGQQFERVTLFVAEWDREYFKNSQLLLVGLTRHKQYLEIKTDINLSNLSVAEVKSHNYA